MIEVEHLSKEFKVREPGQGVGEKLIRLINPSHTVIRAVDDISLTIERGEIVGYLGPNGAGKSTFIKLLTGVLKPTSGSLRVNEHIPHQRRKENAYQIGVVYGQRSQLWWDLPLIDSFRILRAMYRVSRETFRSRIDALIDLLEMGEFIGRPVRMLSLGQRMRGEIAAALIHDPSILFLDEPTIGLDVVSKSRILQLILDLNNRENTTVILTTHNLDDVELVCPRIIIVDRGKKILDQSRDRILETLGRGEGDGRGVRTTC